MQGIPLPARQSAAQRHDGHAVRHLALGQRRAEVARKYLVDLGVAPARVDTVGYGENRPAVEGHTEEAWAANRRVEFRLLDDDGAQKAKPPGKK